MPCAQSCLLSCFATSLHGLNLRGGLLEHSKDCRKAGLNNSPVCHSHALTRPDSPLEQKKRATGICEPGTFAPQRRICARRLVWTEIPIDPKRHRSLRLHELFQLSSNIVVDINHHPNPSLYPPFERKPVGSCFGDRWVGPPDLLREGL